MTFNIYTDKNGVKELRDQTGDYPSSIQGGWFRILDLQIDECDAQMLGVGFRQEEALFGIYEQENDMTSFFDGHFESEGLCEFPELDEEGYPHHLVVFVPDEESRTNVRERTGWEGFSKYEPEAPQFGFKLEVTDPDDLKRVRDIFHNTCPYTVRYNQRNETK